LARPLLVSEDGLGEGAVSADGRIGGAYVHGLFDRAEARAALLGEIGATSTAMEHGDRVEAALDEIAAVLEKHFDLTRLAAIAGLEAHS